MDVRRPLQTSPLGVPDVEFAVARAQAANISPASGWLTVLPLTITALNPVYQVAATITLTAKRTGNFRGRFTGYISNTDSGNHSLFDGMSTGAGNLTPLYAQSPLIIAPSGEGNMATAALIVDFPSLGFTTALGVTTIFNLLVGCDSASHLLILTRACQFEVQEY